MQTRKKVPGRTVLGSVAIRPIDRQSAGPPAVARPPPEVQGPSDVGLAIRPDYNSAGKLDNSLTAGFRPSSARSQAKGLSAERPEEIEEQRSRLEHPLSAALVGPARAPSRGGHEAPQRDLRLGRCRQAPAAYAADPG
eukprot:CAMPEP_0183486140 /NCGR_PEP_ID=MMETSP0370-20130417/179785_1 /TAXON_ID=268820 /ORGANISM="Peridinium aciculiferum, Strain PAER-2" /LENGTH=137 /DNA_ID=CAMNT_0025679451 /DNA_START=643 /DNA_END=1054 /DNA_ORIENTATION=+